MNLKWQFDNIGIDWSEVSEILKLAGMAFHPGAVHEIAFHNSSAKVFVFEENRLIGFGRAISDGAYQAAFYDVAILPDYQGKGLGKAIIGELVKRCPGCNIILYASPGKEKFYEKLNFRKMKTGMALFTNPERMTERGFTE